MKRFIGALLFIALVLSACSQPTPEIVKETVIVRITEPPAPTYTPYPTYAPQEPLPTYTPLPTHTPEEPLPTYTPPPTYTPYPTYTKPPKPTNTPRPTNTPTLAATNTPVPADTPKPTQAAARPDLEILSHQSYVDLAWFHIVGEVRNNSSVPIEYVKIVATLYDVTGKVAGTDYTYTDIDVIPPGGKAPFETGTDEWAGTTQYKLQVQGSPGDLPRQDLVILSHDSYVDGDWLHVRGEVQNTGETEAKYVKVVVTLYDAADQVVGMDYTYCELDVIPPGETSPFETGTDHWPNFDHYEIQVEGS